MSEKQRIPLEQARACAVELLAMLDGTHSRGEIGGSIRRDKETVGDIELVLAATDQRIDGRCDDLVARGILRRRHKSNGALLSWGRRFKAASYNDLPVDLFIVRQDREFGLVFWLRTGPGDANELMVTQRSKGGILPNNMQFHDGQLLRGGTALKLPDEVDVFHAVGMPYIEPHERSVERYRALAGTWKGDAPPPVQSQQMAMFDLAAYLTYEQQGTGEPGAKATPIQPWVWERPWLRSDGYVYVWHNGQWWKARPTQPEAEAYRLSLERRGDYGRGTEAYRLQKFLGLTVEGVFIPAAEG